MATIIKQIKVYNGSAWQTADIGVDASNITLSSNIAGSTNLQTALSNILPASQLAANKIVTTDANKKLTTVDISSTQLGYLSGTTASIQTQLNGKVAKTGDTMTGDLTIAKTSEPIYYAKNTSYSAKNGTTNPTSTVVMGRHSNMDKDGNSCGWMTTYKSSSGVVTTQFATRCYNSSNQMIANTLSLGIDNNGSRTVSVSNPTQWRNAIGAVNVAGDTMTGDLTINKTSPQVFCKSTNINSAVGQTIPSSGETQQGGMEFIDNQGYNTGWVRQYKNASDNTYIQNVVRRKVGSSDVTNSLSLGIKADGSKYVTVSDGSIWRTAIGAQASGNYILSSVSHYNTTSLLTGSSYATIGDVNFYLIGKRICFATFRLVWKANMTAGTSYTIATVANAALRPPTYTTCSTSLGDFTMQEGGSITLRPSQNLTSATGNMYVDFMYITRANYPS